MTGSQSTPHHFNFQSLTDFFVAHGSMSTDSTNRETQEHFGLLPASYLKHAGSAEGDDAQQPSWQEFAKHVEQLNQGASDGVYYKVLFVTRHGQGFHNVTEAKYGTEEWERKWGLLNGDGTVTWADADLTEKGELQARENGKVWRRLLEEQQIPFPSLYTSPLQRCLATTRIQFEDLAKQRGTPFRPIVKEFLRERMGRHTCDRRSTRTWIQENYPTFVIEPGFSESDELFNPDVYETNAELQAREQALLEDLFANETSTFVSLTMHSLAARQLMLAIGHEAVRLAPAATMAFLVKAEKPTGSKGLL